MDLPVAEAAKRTNSRANEAFTFARLLVRC